MHRPSVGIIILNYNRADDTINCINSLRKIDYSNYSIFVIDNSSTDNSYEFLRSKLTDCQVLSTNENLGYTGGVNYGLRKLVDSDFEYLLLLNNDTIVEKEFLTELVKSLEEKKEAFAACGTILCEHDREQIWYASGKLIPWRGLAVHINKGKKFKRTANATALETSFITGCMILLKRNYLNQIGFEDERFFMYLDDIEYSARVQRLGLKLLYVPSSIIYHKVLGETENPFKLYYSARNRLLLINCAFGGMQAFIARIYFLFVISLKMVYWKFFNQDFYAAARLGLSDYFKGNFYKGNGFRFLN